MILRKPYAFFIKHFRLFHLILAILTVYMAHRTKIVLDFFNNYINNVVNVAGQDLTGNLMYGIIFILPIFIILISALILGILALKKKPFTFYIINIAIYIFTFVILQIANGTLLNLQQTLVEVRTLRLVRDFISLSFLLQLLPCVMIGIRAIGFDIRKFDFKHDLQDLQIEESDNEEVEVEVSVDRNKVVRSIRRMIRFSKYIYKENRLLVNLAISISVVAVLVIVVIIMKGFGKTIRPNTFFEGNNFSLEVVDSYVTDKDYRGNTIQNDSSYVIVRIRIGHLYDKDSFDIATAKLIIDPYIYTPTIHNKDKLFDFGNIYNGEIIQKEYEYKTLIYEIPSSLADDTMIFTFVNKELLTEKEALKHIKVKLENQTFKNYSTKTYSLNDTIDFTDSIIENYQLSISSFEIQDKFKLQYNFCVSQECMTSYEYIKPNVTTIYDKALLKVRGTLTKGENFQLAGVYDLYDFINAFGKLKYTINGEEKTQTIAFQKVQSKRTTSKDTFYIEVLQEVTNAEHITLSFTLRKQIYDYILK